MRRLLIAALALGGCASTEMARYVGKPVHELELAYGPPINVMRFPDGRLGYQYRWGGGVVATPSHTSATAYSIAGVTTVNTTATPGAIVSTPGCVITFITDLSGQTIEDTRPPREVVC